MILATTIEIYAGGKGSGCNPEVGKCGRPDGRSARATASHNPVTAEKRIAAAKYEKLVSQAIGGILYGDSAPFDVVKGRIGIEVKTIMPGAKNDKVTVHPSSREHKLAEGKKMKIKRTYLVAIDTREKGNVKVYFKAGIGAYRLKNMTEVGGFQDLMGYLK